MHESMKIYNNENMKIWNHTNMGICKCTCRKIKIRKM